MPREPRSRPRKRAKVGGDPPSAPGSLEYPTTEIGGVESLFTPEGIERLNALRKVEPEAPPLTALPTAGHPP